MKLYVGRYDTCPRCGRNETLGRIRRRGWMRILPGSKHVSCIGCNMDFVVIGRVEIPVPGKGNDKEDEELPPLEGPLWVRTDRNELRGPYEVQELIDQVIRGQVEPTFLVSDDQEHWLEACEIEELEMNWLVRFPDGELYGPVHINRVKELFRTDQIGHDAAAMHKSTHETRWVADL